MTYVERARLNNFITDSKYFSFNEITVQKVASWRTTQLPQAMTCSNTLSIPLYESEAEMLFMLSAASMHLGYGFE
jgi:hypothetical protein